MSGTDARRELDRVVDRLRSMPLARLAVAAPLAWDTCQQIQAAIGDDRPVPRLADHAAGDQLAVVAQDALQRSSGSAAVISHLLVELRRALP